MKIFNGGVLYGIARLESRWKKDIVDNVIEYQIYKHSMENNKTINKNTSIHSGGISNFGAIVATIDGLFLAAGITVLFGGGEDTPVILIIILWIICGGGLGVWFDSIGF